MQPWVQPLLIALFAGWLCGIIVCIPLGPVGLAIVNQTLRNGFRSGYKFALGAVCADCIYAALMLAGHSALLYDYPVVTVALRIVAVAFMGGIAVRYMRFRPEKVLATEAAAERKQEILEERWHHPRGFLLGFGMTITNVLLAVLWATLAAFLFAHDWVGPEPLSRTVCVIGVFLGQATWFFALTTFVARAHRHINPRTVATLIRICGVILLVMTILLGWRMFWGAHAPPTRRG